MPQFGDNKNNNPFKIELNMVNLEIRIRKINNQFQASCEKLNIHAFGETKAKAIIRLKLIIQFYMETSQELGYNLIDDLENNHIQNITRFKSSQIPDTINYPYPPN
jgi:predicted RNase H-like HicB family nuclease